MHQGLRDIVLGILLGKKKFYLQGHGCCYESLWRANISCQHAAFVSVSFPKSCPCCLFYKLIWNFKRPHTWRFHSFFPEAPKRRSLARVISFQDRVWTGIPLVKRYFILASIHKFHLHIRSLSSCLGWNCVQLGRCHSPPFIILLNIQRMN